MKKSYFIYWLKPLQWNMFHWKAHHKFNVDPKEIKDLSCTPSNELFNKVKQLIEEGRTTIAQTVNVALTVTY